MTYKLAGLVFVLLLSTPVYSQELSPLITVDFPRTIAPTVTITGQEFVQTYIVKFIDLTDRGEEIIIKEDELNLGSLGDFEVLKFEVEKNTKKGLFLEHVWYLKYTLRIINPEKKIYVIPPIPINWSRRDIGQNNDSPAEANTIQTGEVPVNYISTVIADDPYTSIRDEINFGSFSERGLMLFVASVFLGTVPLLLWIFFFVRYLRMPYKKAKTEFEKTNADDVIADDPLPSRRSTLKTLRQLDRLKVEEFLAASKGFLRANLPEIKVGSTFSEISFYILKNTKESSIKWKLHRLSEFSEKYQSNLERGINDPVDWVELKIILGEFNWYRRLISRLKRK